MQSSRSAADPRGPGSRGLDPLAPGPVGFAHRGLHEDTAFPENSLVAFAAALELGCGIECDLRLTADDQILVFHDTNAWRLCASRMVIGQSKLKDLSRLSIGGQPIPTLPSLLRLVGGRVPLLLEVKVENDLWRWVPALRRDLDGYRGAFGLMSFDPRLPRLLKTNLPRMRRGLVVRDGLPPLRRRVAVWLASPNFLAVDKAALGKPWVARQRERLPVYGWTIRTAVERAQAQVQADALIWEGDGRPRN